MVSYIIKKLLYGLLIFISVATVVFFLFSASFPTPDELATGQRSDEKTKLAIQREFGLDKPVWKQYVLYLNDISFISLYSHQSFEDINVSKAKLLKFEDRSLVLKFPYLRRSFQSGKQVNTILSEAFKGTMILAVASIVLASLFGGGDRYFSEKLGFRI